MSESYIPPDFDRRGSDGELIDIASGFPIGQLDYYGGWERGPDGTAYREDRQMWGQPVVSAVPSPDQRPVLLLLLL